MNSHICDKEKCKNYNSIDIYCTKDEKTLKELSRGSQIYLRTDECQKRYREENNICYGICDTCRLEKCLNENMREVFFKREYEYLNNLEE